MNKKLPRHILQSKEWGQFKTKMETKAIGVKNVQFTLHPIPFTNLNLGYCPKVTPKDIDWEKLKDAGKKNNSVAIRFDVPNSFGGEEKEFERHCVKAPKDTFAKWDVLLDISKSEEELLKATHSKTRYNIRLAERKGVVVKETSNDEGIRIFNKLHKETALRQGFFIHPDKYYEEAFKTLNK